MELQPGDLIILRYNNQEDDNATKIGVLVKVIFNKDYPDLLPGGISGWLCLVDGEVGEYLRPYWEVEICES